MLNQILKEFVDRVSVRLSKASMLTQGFVSVNEVKEILEDEQIEYLVGYYHEFERDLGALLLSAEKRETHDEDE